MCVCVCVCVCVYVCVCVMYIYAYIWEMKEKEKYNETPSLKSYIKGFHHIVIQAKICLSDFNWTQTTTI